MYAGTHVSDEPYLFYPSDPLSAKKPVAAWSGAAFIFETSEIKDWILKNAPGMPDQLSSCFAWHITLNRDLSVSYSNDAVQMLAEILRAPHGGVLAYNLQRRLKISRTRCKVIRFRLHIDGFLSNDSCRPRKLTTFYDSD